MVKKILVVDDDSVDNRTMSTILKKAGYTVYSVQSGKAALNIADKNKFDLVLLDIRMPDMSGYDVLAKLRKKDKKLKAIYVTIVPEKIAKQRGASNANGFIQKPFSPEKFIIKVKKALG